MKSSLAHKGSSEAYALKEKREKLAKLAKKRSPWEKSSSRDINPFAKPVEFGPLEKKHYDIPKSWSLLAKESRSIHNSSYSEGSGDPKFCLEDKVVCAEKLGTVKFVGRTVLGDGLWIGIDFGRQSTEGEHNGTVEGIMVCSGLYTLFFFG